MGAWLEVQPIRTRIFLLSQSIFLPMMALLGWLLVGNAQRARDDAFDRIRIIAHVAASELQETLARSELVLGTIAARPGIRALDSARCGAIDRRILRLDAQSMGIAVLDPLGHVVCSFDSDASPWQSAARAGWFEAALRAGASFQVSDGFIDPRTGRWAAMLSYPVRNEAGVPAARIFLGFDPLELGRQLAATAPKGTIISVVDSTRTILLRSAEPEAYVGTRAGPALPDPAPDEREGYFSATDRQGVKRLFAYARLPGVGWTIAASRPQAEVLSPYYATLAWTGAALLVLLALAVESTRRLSAAIVRPISRLEYAARQIASGAGGTRADVAGPPEIKAVAEQFNRMLDSRNLSDARLRGIFESTLDSIITADEQLVIVQANPAAALAFRCGMDDLIGAPLDRFIPGRFRDRHRSEVLAFGSGSEGSRHMGRTRDVLALRADGEEFVIEATISHMAVGGRQLYTVIHRDVTERVNAETELRDSKARLDAALASMSDAVFISDDQGRFVEINEAFATFHRFADKPSCRKTLAEYPEILEVTLPDGRPAALEQWAVPRALRGETATNVEYGLRRKDSGERWIGSYSFAPIRNGAGAIVGSVVTARDITALKQVQTDLEDSNAALQRLIASQDRVQEDERRRIARELHDELQQTLAAIRMDLAEIANAPAGDDAARRRLLARSDGLLAGAITATRRIVGDLRPPILEDLGLVPALQALAKDFARRSGMACEVRAPEQLGEMLDEAPATALCLYRIAQEALNNAAKHSQARNVQIRLAIASAHEIVLSVSDDGRGLNAADTRKTESFGILGMRERARAQGGVVRVDRGPGGGTVLEARIPLSPRPAEGQAPEPVPAAAEPGLAPAYRDSGPGGLDDADALPRLLGRAARLTLQGVIDALPGHVAVLDPQGVVRFVNRAWLEFARQNGDPPLQAIGPGANYLEVCRRAAPDDASALVVRQGLIDVIAAARADFSCEYACHSPDAQRWFRMHASTMTNGDILVAHFPR